MNLWENRALQLNFLSYFVLCMSKELRWMKNEKFVNKWASKWLSEWITGWMNKLMNHLEEFRFFWFHVGLINAHTISEWRTVLIVSNQSSYCVIHDIFLIKEWMHLWTSERINEWINVWFFRRFVSLCFFFSFFLLGE